MHGKVSGAVTGRDFTFSAVVGLTHAFIVGGRPVIYACGAEGAIDV